MNGVHVPPLFVDLQIKPFKPVMNAVPSMRRIFVRLIVVPVTEGVQLVPPLVVMQTSPLSPAMQPLIESANETPLRFLFVPVKRLVMEKPGILPVPRTDNDSTKHDAS